MNDAAASGPPPRVSELNAVRRTWRHYEHWHARLILTSVLAGAGAVAQSAAVVVVAALATGVASGSAPTTPAVLGHRIELSDGELVAIGLVTVALWCALGIVVAFLRADLVADYDAAQRHRVVDAFAHTAWPVQAASRQGELLDLLASYLNQTRMAALSFIDAVVSSLAFVILLAGGLLSGGWVAVVVAGCLLAIAVAVRPVSGWTRRAAQEVARATPRFANRVAEVVELAKPIKAFDVAGASVHRVDATAGDLRRAWRRLYLAQGIGPLVVQIALLALAVVGLGVLVSGRVAEPTRYVASVLLLYRSSQYGRSLQVALQALTIASPFQERIDEEVAGFEQRRDAAGDEPMPRLETFEADGIGRTRPGDPPVLHDVTFTVHRGEIVGLSGRSGVGKTTLVDLLLRLDGADAGELRINGRAVDHIDLAGWRRAVAFVPQEGVLLDDTVAANVRFLRDGITDADVDAALRAAGVFDEVLAMAGGLGAQVGERGGRLSVGQRQRLCLARALVADPQLLILDEPTSALDPVSEEAIGHTLDGLRGRVTVILVSHRSETLAVCDRVLRLTDGRIEELTGR